MAYDVQSFGGSFRRQADTTHVVSYWRIPGGADYEHATVLLAFFNDEEQAKLYTKKHEMPPDMAICFTVAEHDAILAKAKPA